MGKDAFKNIKAKKEGVNENEKRKTVGNTQSKSKKIFQNISDDKSDYRMEYREFFMKPLSGQQHCS